jgi:hypothetical protein
MAKLAVLVSPPVKTPAVASNCKVAYSSTEVSLLDNTGYRSFTQRADFDMVITSLDRLVRSASFSPSRRVVSLCSEFSTPTPRTVRETCLQFVRRLYPEEVGRAIPISAGLLLDAEVNDFFAPRRRRSDAFDLLETYSLNDALDLIETGFDRFRRLRESVFVIHVGEDDSFFEWVVVPRCDVFLTAAAVGSLPPNEKLIFVLKEHRMFAVGAIERYRRISSAFRLVADSFCDVATTWCFHLPTGVSFRSNSALLELAAMIREASRHTFPNIGRSQLFRRGAGADSDAAPLPQNKDQEAEAAQIEAQLLQLLHVGGGSDDEIDPVRAKRERRRLEIEEQERLAREERERAEAERRRAEEEARRRREREEQERRDRIARELRDEELRQIQIADDERRAEEEALRRQEEERQQAIADEDRRFEDEEQARLEREKERRRREAREREERTRRTEEGRKRGLAKTPRDRIAALRKKRELVAAEEDSDDNEGLAADAKARQSYVMMMMRLIRRAMKAAANENTSVDELMSLDSEVLENLGNRGEKRAKMERQCKALANQLRTKTRLSETATKECRLVRRNHLEVHNDGVQARSGRVQRITKKGGEASGGSGADYDLTIQYLNGEIKKVTADIQTLRLRSQTQFLDLDDECTE